MSEKREYFEVGDIITIKSHPLYSEDENSVPKKIREFSAQVPPLMMVKEVIYEKEDKKVQFSDIIVNARIADLVKYVCVFFNANKSEFVEKVIYHSFVCSYEKLKYYRKKDKDNKEKKIETELIPEVLNYKQVDDYLFGKRIQFKTKKLEHRKSFSINSEKLPVTSFQTPDFILTGLRNEEKKDMFYFDGKPKKEISDVFYKVMWFNHFQLKFSEEYLPKEFFVEGLEI